MAIVQLDSSDLNGIVKDATGEPLDIVKAEEPKEPKVEAKTEEKPKEEEDEDGLTETEKRELTEKMQKAIAKRTRALREAEEFAADQYNERQLAEQRAEAFQKETERLRSQLPPEKTPELEKPSREKFETEEAFREAEIDYKVEMKIRDREQKAQAQREAERQAQVMETAKARIAKARELVANYDEIVGAADIVVPPVIAGYMQESELFAELGLHFAQHPQELIRLSKLSAAKALVEVGKIESKLTPFAQEDGTPEPKVNGAKPKVEEPNTETDTRPSKPRAPITPIGHGIVSQVEKPPSERSYQEERAAWSKKHNANFSKRQRH